MILPWKTAKLNFDDNMLNSEKIVTTLNNVVKNCDALAMGAIITPTMVTKKFGTQLCLLTMHGNYSGTSVLKRFGSRSTRFSTKDFEVCSSQISNINSTNSKRRSNLSFINSLQKGRNHLGRRLLFQRDLLGR